MKKLSTMESARLSKELRTYMDIQNPGRREDYGVKLAKIQRRMQRGRDGLFVRLMVWLAVRREMKRAKEEAISAWANAHG